MAKDDRAIEFYLPFAVFVMCLFLFRIIAFVSVAESEPPFLKATPAAESDTWRITSNGKPVSAIVGVDDTGHATIGGLRIVDLIDECERSDGDD